MLKKIILIFLLIFINFWFLINNNIFALDAPNAPKVNCIWLPWCDITNNDWKVFDETWLNTKWWEWMKWIWNVIAEWIKYVSVLAVLSLIISWFFYILSWWEDEKTKKAKRMIIWSLIWVIISITAWWIINLVNKINI